MEGGPSSIGRPPHRQASHGKRTHSQMEAGHHRRSPSPLFIQQHSSSSASDGDSPPQRRRRSNPHLTLPRLQARFHGDGLDHRTPISTMNNTQNQIIDLTDDDDYMTSAHATPQPEPAAPPPRPQRLPRFSREIIDLSAETSPPEPGHADLPRSQERHDRHADFPQPQAPYDRRSPHRGAPVIRSSPEVQFVSERPRSPRSRLLERHPTPYEQNRGHEGPVLDLTVDIDDEVVHVRTAERAGINLDGPQGGHGAGFLDRGGLGVGRLATLLRRAAPGRELQWPDLRHLFAIPQAPWFNGEEDDGEEPYVHGLAQRAATRARPAANVPNVMDYTTIGFGIALEEGTPPRPPTPKYSPPPEPGLGYTRSPQEHDELICPNCKEELGIGNTDEKKQVWIVKACGHVYCGECMVNRKSKPKGKGKAKVVDNTLPHPFNHCQAPGCDKTTNKNQVMQIFL